MKPWPNKRTNFNHVRPSLYRLWQAAICEMKLCDKSKAWLTKQGDYPDGQLMFEKAKAKAVKEAEALRLQCREMDIVGRWTMRKFERRLLAKPVLPNPFWITPMGYDQVIVNRKLVEI